MQGVLRTLFGKTEPFYAGTTIYALENYDYKWLLKGGETPIISSLHQYLGEQPCVANPAFLSESVQSE